VVEKKENRRQGRNQDQIYLIGEGKEGRGLNRNKEKALRKSAKKNDGGRKQRRRQP